MASKASFNTYHTVSSSSLSRPFYFSNHHSLVDTSIEDPESGCTWNNLEKGHLQKAVKLYDLEELFSHYSFDISNYAEKVKVEAPSNIGKQHHAILFAHSMLEDNTNIVVQADIQCECFRQHLVPFLSSVYNRVDGNLQIQFDEGTKVPLLMIEVHSSPYKNTVSQTAVDILDQFRVLRCIGGMPKEISGFTFPKYGEKTCVTKVKVRFVCNHHNSEFHFVITLHPLSIDSVGNEIKTALANNSEYCIRKYEYLRSFLRLREEELHELCETFGEENLVQISTPHSIILLGNEVVYKLVPNPYEAMNLFNLKGSTRNSHPEYTAIHIDEIYLGSSCFFVYNRYFPPLSPKYVSECIQEFLFNVSAALVDLHKCNFAHLDVRIPNVCFLRKDGTYKVILIDLDRSRRKLATLDFSDYGGEMYKHTTMATCEALDWKQLGLLVCRVLFKETDARIMLNKLYAQDDCLKELIVNGKWNATACLNSRLLTENQKRTLQECLDEQYRVS